MDESAIWTAIVGPGGGLVILALLVMSLVRWRYVVPGYIYEAEKERADKLDLENSELNETVTSLTIQNAELRSEVRAMRSELESLREQVSHLRQELDG